MPADRRQATILLVGVGLVIAGIVIIFLQVSGVNGLSSWIPLACAAAFLIAAFATRNAVLFLAAGILLGAAGGAFLVWTREAPGSTEASEAARFLALFGVGWILVLPLTWMFAERILLWPVAPGIAAEAVAFVIGVSGGSPAAYLPIAVILITVAPGLAAFWFLRRRRR